MILCDCSCMYQNDHRPEVAQSYTPLPLGGGVPVSVIVSWAFQCSLNNCVPDTICLMNKHCPISFLTCLFHKWPLLFQYSTVISILPDWYYSSRVMMAGCLQLQVLVSLHFWYFLYCILTFQGVTGFLSSLSHTILSSILDTSQTTSYFKHFALVPTRKVKCIHFQSILFQNSSVKYCLASVTYFLEVVFPFQEMAPTLPTIHSSLKSSSFLLVWVFLQLQLYSQDFNDRMCLTADRVNHTLSLTIKLKMRPWYLEQFTFSYLGLGTREMLTSVEQMQFAFSLSNVQKK